MKLMVKLLLITSLLQGLTFVANVKAIPIKVEWHSGKTIPMNISYGFFVISLTPEVSGTTNKILRFTELTDKDKELAKTGNILVC